ncbi:MAG: hypothetical protein FGM50_02625 [Mycobacterium sp.]|nr:hypothetical protein [Mycobacterium sp.]
MTTKIRPFMSAGAALASVGALVIATPSMGAQMDLATASASDGDSLNPAYVLLSKKSQWQGLASFGYDDDDDDDDDDHHGYGDDDDDDDRGGFGGSIADFLANNQAEVLAVTALIPVFYLGPVAVGNSLLATAYYDGYNGSAPGLEGVVSYVTSQFGVPPTNVVEGVVLGLTSLIPQFNIGPVAVGNSLLATAYFSGYNGSATGLPGVISYVTSQLGLQTPPGGAEAVSVRAAAAVAEVSSPVSAPATVSLSRAAIVHPAASQKDDDQNDGADTVQGTGSGDNDASAVTTEPKADTAAPRSSGRAASAKAGSGQAKERSARSAAKSAADAG